MMQVRFLPPAAKFIKKLKVMSGTRENFYDRLKRYIKS